MKRIEAKKLAKQLYRKGETSTAVIAEQLAKAGYKSQRTGEPLTVGGVNALLYAKRKRTKKTTNGNGIGNGEITEIEKAKLFDIMKAIISEDGLPDARKVALQEQLIA